MFMGEYNHTIDPKNRLIVPQKFRDQLGETFVVSAAFDKCLYLSTTEKWSEFAEQLSQLPASKDNRQLVRHFMKNAAECETDKAGRILIPPQLVEMAGLTKDVVLVGVGNKIEIWSKERYDEINADDNTEDIAEKMSIEYNIHF